MLHSQRQEKKGKTLAAAGSGRNCHSTRIIRDGKQNTSMLLVSISRSIRLVLASCGKIQTKSNFGAPESDW
jgi:hypothetical protein